MVKLARKTGASCVTVDGETASSNGVLSGGFVNKERGKMALWQKYKTATKSLEEEEKELAEVETAMAELGRNLDRMTKEIEEAREKSRRIEVTLSTIDLGSNDAEIQLEQAVTQLASMQWQLTSLGTEKSRLQAEEKQEMRKSLTAEERRRCEELVKEIQKA